jgi:cell division protein FtsI/penicillin-binding protein 2
LSDRAVDHLTWRHRLLALLMLAAVVVVVGRLAQLQIADHDLYLEQATEARAGAAVLPAPRGPILDAGGYPLAISLDSWDIYIDRFLWSQRPDEAQAAATDLAAVLGVTREGLLEQGLNDDRGDVRVRRDLDYDQGLALQEQGLWGVRVLPSAVRVYPEGDLAGPLLGYVGGDQSGLWGLEADFDHILRGRDGVIAIERDALGRPLAFSPRSERSAEPGGEIHLTIDRAIQTAAERHLRNAILEHSASGGSILVMDPRDGAILAMANWPAVGLEGIALEDPNLLDSVRNRIVTDLYEPGSVFKTLTTAIAIDTGRVTPESTYEDKGVVEIGQRRIVNWDNSVNGTTNVRTFLQRSLNTGAVWLAELVGPEVFYDYVQRFGIGELTHVGLTGEAEGVMRLPDDSDWYMADLGANSFGHGLNVTPLQVLTAVNTFANGGMLMRPYVISSIVTDDDVRIYEPVAVRQVVSEETANTVAALMNDVVDGVPFHRATVEGYSVAGKTGTTEVSSSIGYDPGTTIVSFAGFLPYENPQISILVKIDEPQGERILGGEVAAPVFSDLAGEIMDYLGVPSSGAQLAAAQ